MKIATIIGARPQFIKAAVVSRQLRNKFDEIIIHTGQHYDENMSGIFFAELNIPKPDYNLNINGKSHGKMTGEMLISIEKILMDTKPDMVLLYGDTNSTLAGALAAAKLHIPICHVEAGNRLKTLSNPEEINRVLTDRISSLLLCSVRTSVTNLKNEGRTQGVHYVGDPMYDAYIYYSDLKGGNMSSLELLSGGIIDIPNKYYYLTCHREENTREDGVLMEILSAMESLDFPVVFPVHPRIQTRTQNLIKENNYKNIIATSPVGYLESIALIDNAYKVITDSGGVQREAFFAKKQCVTIFDFIVWPETMVGNRNQLSKPCREDILKKVYSNQTIAEDHTPFGDGHSAEKILGVVGKYLERQ